MVIFCQITCRSTVTLIQFIITIFVIMIIQVIIIDLQYF
ncbi:GSCOCG00003267001-RA-CDS [Cotesia congregata]|nr:GSCOCG00003267001-RA-CDS [Cotesia congregata]